MCLIIQSNQSNQSNITIPFYSIAMNCPSCHSILIFTYSTNRIVKNTVDQSHHHFAHHFLLKDFIHRVYFSLVLGSQQTEVGCHIDRVITIGFLEVIPREYIYFIINTKFG